MIFMVFTYYMVFLYTDLEASYRRSQAELKNMNIKVFECLYGNQHAWSAPSDAGDLFLKAWVEWNPVDYCWDALCTQ